MKELKKVLSKVLGIKSSKINDQTSPNNVKKWDSFHGLLLFTEIENNYNMKFTMDDIILIRNVGDIKKTLQRHGVRIED